MGGVSKTNILSLPLDLRLKILRFLPTHEAMACSLLSTAWTGLWKTSPVMTFDHRDHNPDSFQRFVEKTLSQHQGNLDHLHLIIDSRTSTMDLACWVGHATRRNLQRLIIEGSARERVLLPANLFNNSDLKFLSLKGSLTFQVPSHVSLTKLGVLELLGVKLSTDMDGIFNNCPSLKNLTIYRTSGHPMKSLVFSNPSLEFLKIEDQSRVKDIYTITCSGILTFRGFLSRIPRGLLICTSLTTLELGAVSCSETDIPTSLCLPMLRYFRSVCMRLTNPTFSKLLMGFPALQFLFIVFYRGVNCERDYTLNVPTLEELIIKMPSDCDYKDNVDIVLDTPSVRRLHISDRCSVLVDIQNMPFLADASLELRVRNFTRFLDAIKSANRLYLCLHRDITSAIPLLSFTQLLDLTLCTCGGDAWSRWLDLIQQCPELRALRFSENHEVKGVKYKLGKWKEPSSPLNLSHLDLFEWRQFDGNKQDKRFLRFLLKSSPELKHVRISKSFAHGTSKGKVKSYYKRMRKEFAELSSRLSLEFLLD